MSKFDAGQGNGRTPERLEASHHRGASAFDRSMILLNNIVEVLVTSHLNILPLRILPPQKPKGHVTLQVAIKRDLARPPRQTRRQSLAKERLCSSDAAIRPQEKNHGLAVLVDSSIEITKRAPNIYIGFRPHARKYSPAVQSGAIASRNPAHSESPNDESSCATRQCRARPSSPRGLDSSIGR